MSVVDGKVVRLQLERETARGDWKGRAFRFLGPPTDHGRTRFVTPSLVSRGRVSGWLDQMRAHTAGQSSSPGPRRNLLTTWQCSTLRPGVRPSHSISPAGCRSAFALTQADQHVWQGHFSSAAMLVGVNSHDHVWLQVFGASARRDCSLSQSHSNFWGLSSHGDVEE